jgi:hypothetical protein
MPISMIFNLLQNDSNVCSFESVGGNQSPELSWTHAPHATRSFVVIAYDTTAAFTHWGDQAQGQADPQGRVLRPERKHSDLDRLYIERGSECLFSVLGVRHIGICER